MSIWLVEQDFVNAISYTTLVACTDDNNTGVVNASALNGIIERAEYETMSWLIPEFGPAPLPDDLMAQFKADPSLKYAALDYGIAYLFDRHPEYIRSKAREDRLKRAKEAMEDFLESRRRPVTVETPPANVGGVSVDNANRLYVDNPDGTKNSGDY